QRPRPERRPPSSFSCCISLVFDLRGSLRDRTAASPKAAPPRLSIDGQDTSRPAAVRRFARAHPEAVQRDARRPRTVPTGTAAPARLGRQRCGPRGPKPPPFVELSDG